MAPSVGSITLISLRAEPDRPGQVVEVLARPGVDGTGFRQTGVRAEPFRAVAVVDVDDAAAADSLVGDFKALQGTVVEIEDDFGRTADAILVLRVRLVSRTAVKTAVGGVSSEKGLLLRFALDLHWAEGVTS
mgnify:CR=1 FL=1